MSLAQLNQIGGAFYEPGAVVPATWINRGERWPRLELNQASYQYGQDALFAAIDNAFAQIECARQLRITDNRLIITRTFIANAPLLINREIRNSGLHLESFSHPFVHGEKQRGLSWGLVPVDSEIQNVDDWKNGRVAADAILAGLGRQLVAKIDQPFWIDYSFATPKTAIIADIISHSQIT